MTLPTLGQMLLGTEGLALLRLAAVDDVAARDARVAEIRELIARYDAELAVPLDTPEYGTQAGYALWSATYDAPLRLFPVERSPRSAPSWPPCRPAASWMPSAAPVATARGSPPAATRWWAWTPRPTCSKARAKLPQARFEQGDLAALPLPDACVDAALCALALVHLPDLRPALSELARVVRQGGLILISDVHPFLVALGWQAQFRTADGGTGFVRLNRHLPSDYAQAAIGSGLTVRGMQEPLLPPESAVMVAQGPIPDANAIAWAGLPG